MKKFTNTMATILLSCLIITNTVLVASAILVLIAQ